MNEEKRYAFEHGDVEVLDSITFLVPCRAFTIGYCISEERRFGVVDEFLMRLVHIAGALRFEQIQEYFGFSVLEMQKVLEPLLSERALERYGDSFRIGPAGAECFQGNDDEIPRITVVESREDSFRMDLISYMPAPFENMARMLKEKRIRPKMLWEVEIPSSAEPRSSVEVARKAFNRSWIEFLEDKGLYAKMRKAGLTLYKTDYVTTGDRYMLPVRCVSLIAKSGVSDRQFLPYKTPMEQESREALFRSIAEGIRKSQPKADYASLFTLSRLAGNEWLSPFLIEGAIFQTFLFIKQFVEHPEVVRDGCVFIFGASYVERNLWLLVEKVKELNRMYGAENDQSNPRESKGPLPIEITWVRPQISGWGRTELLFEGLEVLKETARFQGRLRLSVRLAENRAVGAACGGKVPKLRWFGEHFDDLMTFRSGGLGPGMEIVLCHDHAVMVLAHSVPLSPSGTILPIGFYSEDREVVERVSSVLQKGNLRRLPREE